MQWYRGNQKPKYNKFREEGYAVVVGRSVRTVSGSLIQGVIYCRAIIHFSRTTGIGKQA